MKLNKSERALFSFGIRNKELTKLENHKTLLLYCLNSNNDFHNDWSKK